MAGEVKSRANLEAQFPIQQNKEISAQDILDFLASAFLKDDADQASGILGLDDNALPAPARLGSGSPDATKYLRGDGAWAVPAAAIPTFRTGQYYGGLLPTALNTSGGIALVADKIYATPFFVPDTRSFDRLGIEIITAAAAGKLLRVGILSDDGALSPDALVVDSGALAADTAGVALVEATIAQSLRGLYWLVIVSNGTPTVRAIATGAAPPILGEDVSGLAGTANVGLTHWEGTFTYAALPAAWSSVTTPVPTVGNAPMVIVRAA